jgi:hypothetical protein
MNTPKSFGLQVKVLKQLESSQLEKSLKSGIIAGIIAGILKDIPDAFLHYENYPDDFLGLFRCYCFGPSSFRHCRIYLRRIFRNYFQCFGGVVLCFHNQADHHETLLFKRRFLWSRCMVRYTLGCCGVGDSVINRWRYRHCGR